MSTFDHPIWRHFAPPDGWVPVEAEHDGVRVWGPPPDDDDAPQVRSFSCPQCGASTAFDPSLGKLRCDHCGYEASHTPPSRGGAVPRGEFTAAAMAAGERGWGVERQALHCSSCGADIAVAEGQLATSCPFCASNQVDLRAVTGNALRPQQVMPFAVTQQEAGAKAKEWLKGRWMHPADLVDVANVERFRGVYLPWWLFDARMEVDWECEVGTTSTTTYTDSSGRRQTRTTTTWRWKKGQLEAAYTHCPVPGTTKVQGLSKVGTFPMGELRPYDPALLAGFGAHAYDVSLPVAWDEGRHLMRTLTAQRCRNAAGGDKQRNLSVSADMEDEAWTYALMPVYVSAFQFRDRTWVVVVNGATGHVGGQRPVAWWKVYAVMAAALLPGLAIGVCIGLPGLLFAGIGIAVLIVAALMELAGVVIAALTYTSAAAEESL